MADGASDELSAEETAKLAQFQELTGIEDVDRCSEILRAHRWDIELAVHDTFNEREGVRGVYDEPDAVRSRRNASPPAVSNDRFHQRVYYPRRQQPQPVGWIHWGSQLLMLPFRFLYFSVWDLFQFLLSLLRPDPRRMVTDPIADVENFIRKFNADYGRNHPDFYHGSYSQALHAAKDELKFLLVYLHGDDHQDTPQFCSNTLCNQLVIEYINANVLFWACNINSPEGYRVSQALRENSYPFLAVIILKANRMTVVARLEGLMSHYEIIDSLQKIKDDNEIHLIAAREERQERRFNRSLREEQDAAYRESMRQDQEKERRRQEELNRQRETEEKLLQEEQDKINKQEETERLKEVWKNRLPEEPPCDSPDCIRLVIKLPSNTRLERRFSKDHSLKYLYYFVFCHDEAPENFDVVTNLPRRCLPCKPTEDFEPPTFEEAGLGKSEMLFVHDHDA